MTLRAGLLPANKHHLSVVGIAIGHFPAIVTPVQSVIKISKEKHAMISRDNYITAMLACRAFFPSIWFRNLTGHFVSLLLFLLLPFCLQAQEEHLANIRQLTFGGENAEAYFSIDGKQLIYQSTHPPYKCDQIFTMNADGSNSKIVSNGKGRTTCSYFLNQENRILYSSTQAASSECPPPPDYSKGYVWAVFPTFDIYSARPDGSDLIALSPSPGYDAEATVSPDGKKIVFTSDRDGDLELYTMDTNGNNVKRITNFPGYDGGAFFSPDSRQIVFRANHITDEKELLEYRALLQQHLVRPTALEIYVMNADGTGVRQVTSNGAANFCPFFHPNGKQIIFASNKNDPAKRNFDLFLIQADGSGLEQITFHPTFDGFPMFSPDGKQLVFASNRNAKEKGETNIFIADWMETSLATKEGAEVNLLKTHVEVLASDEMKGRLTGSPEAKRASEYIAAEFLKYGLQASPGQSGMTQQFEYTSGVKLGSKNSLSFQTAGKSQAAQVGKDYLPTGFSEDIAPTTMPAVFAGYGIRATDLKHDDYAGLDVKGKAVLVYRHGPEGDDPKSPYAPFYSLRYKAMIAREQGAKAILVVSPDKERDELIGLRNDTSFGTSGIPVLTIKRRVVDTWLKNAGKQFPNPKNPHEQPGSFELEGSLQLECELIREESTSDNVLGWIPSSVPTQETIVIGAHYDHLGLGMEGSLSEKRGVVHNGADDNASGIAGLLELARLFSISKLALRRNLLFIAFGGEELGVLGSSYFMKHPVIPAKSIVAMMNMDMIGRLRGQKLVVGGVGTSPQWKALLTRVPQNSLEVSTNEDGYGPSDHAVFYAKDIPVLFFFTGAHAEYHRPEDDIETLNYRGMQEIVNYIFQIVQQIEEMPKPLEFARVKPSSQSMSAGGFRVYLGTIPDYTENVKGVLLSGVREESPAQKAGFLAGDIIVEFAGRDIQNVYDYTYALQDQKPGDVVTVVVLRDGKRKEMKVTLARRPGNN